MKRALLIVVLGVSATACRSVSPSVQSVTSAGDYQAVILANQECYRRFESIGRTETITVLNRDRDGNVDEQHAREEVVYDIVAMANDRRSIGGVTAHPFFSAQDTFAVDGARDGNVFVRVGSADPSVQYYLDDIVVQIEQATGRIAGMTSDLFIHGGYRDGSQSVSTERLVADWTRINGCDLPESVRYHPVRDTALQRPRLTTEMVYEFADSLSQADAAAAEETVSPEEIAAFEEALAAFGESFAYSGPTTAQIKQSFAEHRAAFGELEAMLREDRRCPAGADSLGEHSTGRYGPDGYAIEVGVDKVCDFWENGGEWDRMSVDAAPIWNATQDEMLESVGLAPERYGRYLDLLRQVRAKRARIYSRPEDPSVPTYWLGGAGWVASSYYVNVVRLPNRPEPLVEDVLAYIEREGYGTYKVYSELGGGWYVEMDMMW